MNTDELRRLAQYALPTWNDAQETSVYSGEVIAYLSNASPQAILDLLDDNDRHKARIAELEGLLSALVARWELFTGPERHGWGNQEQAYYDLAKHAQNEWKAAQAALPRKPE